MGEETIKSFLVGLGFGVDESSLAKFNKAIVSATVKVTALYTGIQVAAAGIFKSISGISEGFEEMGYSLRLVAPSVTKMLQLRQAMISTYQRAGINLVKVVKDSIKFNFSLTKTKYAFEAIYKSVAAKFLPMLTKQMDIFRTKLLNNMPKIQEKLEKFVNFVFKAFSLTVQFGARLWEILGKVYDFFVKLDDATGGWSTKILAVAAAWKFFNLSFLASPIGIILSLATALVLLYDDLMTFREGGDSLINWGSRTTQILVGILTWLNPLHTSFMAWKFTITEIVPWLEKLGSKAYELANKFTPFKVILESIGNLLGWIESKIKSVLSSAGSHIAPLRSVVGDFFAKAGAQTLNAIPGPDNAQPLLPALSNRSVTTNQQTTFNINGTADAHAVAGAVSGQQDQVNFDMNRNQKALMKQ